MIFFPGVTAAGAVTNSADEYEFVAVGIGDYKVTVEAHGFSSATTDMFFAPNSNRVLQFALRLIY